MCEVSKKGGRNMLKLITICLGTAFLMYLSGIYYPTQVQITGRIARTVQKPKTDIFMAIAIFWLTCFMFLRTSYNDTGNYIHFWNNAVSVESFFEDISIQDWTGNPLSDFWLSLSHEWFLNYHIYFLLPSVLICVAVVSLFKRYSVNTAFSILVFFAIGTYVMYMAALKQCLATFILLLAIPYAEKKQYGRFYFLLAFAILFHTHSFMFAIVPFLFGKPWGKVTIIGLAFTLFAIVTYNSTLGAFMEYAQSIGALVDESEVFDGHQIHILRVVVYWIPTILALLFRKRLFKDSTRMENLFMNMSSVAAFILTIGTVQAANLFARMAGYFEIAMAISVPWILYKLFNKRSAIAVSVLAGVLYFGYFLYEFGVSKDFGNQYSAITLWQFILEIIG